MIFISSLALLIELLISLGLDIHFSLFYSVINLVYNIIKVCLQFCKHILNSNTIQNSWISVCMYVCVSIYIYNEIWSGRRSRSPRSNMISLILKRAVQLFASYCTALSHTLLESEIYRPPDQSPIALRVCVCVWWSTISIK